MIFKPFFLSAKVQQNFYKTKTFTSFKISSFIPKPRHYFIQRNEILYKILVFFFFVSEKIAIFANDSVSPFMGNGVKTSMEQRPPSRL